MNSTFNLVVKTVDLEDADAFWEMTVEVDSDTTLERDKLEVTLVGLIGTETNRWDSLLWHRHGYKRWWWFDKDECDKFVSYFTLKYAGNVKTYWDLMK